MHPLRRAANEASVRLAAAAEIELLHDQKRGPLAHALLQGRQEAIDALVAMVKQDPAQVEQMRKLQNEVQRFVDLCRFAANIFTECDRAEMELSIDDAEELRAIQEDGAEPAGDA